MNVWACTTLDYSRDGWSYIERVELGSKWKAVHIFEKRLRSGWTLRKLAHAEIGASEGKGCYWDEHELVHPVDESGIKCPDWEWADIDGQRLAWAAGGKLNCGQLTASGLTDVTELADFGAMTFAPIEAPY